MDWNLQEDEPKAWEFFQTLTPSGKKVSLWWVMQAKRKETRERRLKTLIESSLENRKIPLLRTKDE